MTERKHLTGFVVEKLLAATKGSRHADRGRCLLLLMFRHGLRPVTALRRVLLVAKNDVE